LSVVCVVISLKGCASFSQPSHSAVQNGFISNHFNAKSNLLNTQAAPPTNNLLGKQRSIIRNMGRSSTTARKAMETSAGQKAFSIFKSLSLPTSFSNLVSSLFTNSGAVPLYQSFSLNIVLFVLLKGKLSSMLTTEGFYHSLALGTMLWATLGWKGWTLCVLYLFLGSIVTKIKLAEKEKMGIAEGRGGRRGPENVWGSAATGLMCAVASVPATTLGISSSIYKLAYVASIATKLADTFASEIGKAFGKTTFLITTLERVEPGTEGAVSLEGTLAAVLGGTLLSLYGYAVGLLDSVPAVIISIVASFLATNAESVIGATLQGKKGFKWMTNEVVNFFNTLIGAFIAISCGMILL